MSRKRKKAEHIPEPVRMHPRRAELLLWTALAALFVYHALHFSFVQDDSFITFRYVRNLVNGNGLVFNIGERVEGYTTFLWTILLAVPALAGIDLATEKPI